MSLSFGYGKFLGIEGLLLNAGTGGKMLFWF